eukprot:1687491-Amphidinium_carterae.1
MYDKESTTRTSVGTSLKGKNEMDESDAKKMSPGASTIIITNNPSIQNFNTLMDPTTFPRSTNMTENADAMRSGVDISGSR